MKRYRVEENTMSPEAEAKTEKVVLAFKIARAVLRSPGPIKAGHYAHVIKPVHRSILMTWMLEICSDLHFPRRVWHASIDHVDVYMALKADVVPIAKYQLVAVASLSLAAKYYYPHAHIDAETCCDLCADVFQKSEVIEMQIALLQATNFRLGEPTMLDRVQSHCLVNNIRVDSRWLQRVDQWLMEPDKSMLGHEAALKAILGTQEPADGPFCVEVATEDDVIPTYNVEAVKAFLSRKSRAHKTSI
jgi:hypothetical protein